MAYVFRLYGFYRTGTNWLAALLRSNVPGSAVLDSRDEKHYPPSPGLPEPGTVAVCIAKHPLAFAASFKRFKPDVALIDALTDYRVFMASVIDSVDEQPRRWRLVQYEKLLRAPVVTLAAITGGAVEIRDPVAETVNRNGARGRPFTRRSYYLEARYRDDLTSDETELVRRESNWAALARFGYSPTGELVWR